MTVSQNPALGPRRRVEQPTGNTRFALLAGLALAAGLQTATQVFAHTFGYAPALGGHLGPLYAPWSILPWASQWYSPYPDAVMRAASLGLLVSTLGLFGVAVAKVMAANTAKATLHLHGSARWAVKPDLEAAGLLPRPHTLLAVLTGRPKPAAGGVYVGGWEDKRGRFHYLRHNGPEHVLTYAPTRSGKGVGLVIPTLFSWPESAVITDLKGELWALSAGWRQHHAGNKVLRFEPAAPNAGVRWNPLDEIRLNTDEAVGDVQNLATLLVDPNGKGLESHWQKTAFALLVGVILHALYRAQQEGTPATLPAVDQLLADPHRDIGALWHEIASYHHLNGENHRLAKEATHVRNPLRKPTTTARFLPKAPVRVATDAGAHSVGASNRVFGALPERRGDCQLRARAYSAGLGGSPKQPKLLRLRLVSHRPGAH